jgi:hypothetical protein
MRVCITIFSIFILISCSSPKDSPQILREQLIGRWIEEPGETFSLGLADITITDSTFFFTDQPDYPAIRYEISPQDSMTLFASPDSLKLKMVLSDNRDTLKLIARKTGRQLHLVREE